MSGKVICSSCGNKGVGSAFKAAQTKNGTRVILCPKCYEHWKIMGLIK